ncbi:unnamed protein product, partial [Ectocarpus sp. 12 AP-2014]
ALRDVVVVVAVAQECHQRRQCEQRPCHVERYRRDGGEVARLRRRDSPRPRRALGGLLRHSERTLLQVPVERGREGALDPVASSQQRVRRKRGPDPLGRRPRLTLPHRNRCFATSSCTANLPRRPTTSNKMSTRRFISSTTSRCPAPAPSAPAREASDVNTPHRVHMRRCAPFQTPFRHEHVQVGF